jgi:hypothetical protein
MNFNRLAPVTIPIVGLFAGTTGVIYDYGFPSFENFAWILYLWSIFILVPTLLVGFVVLTLDLFKLGIHRQILVGHLFSIAFSGIAAFILIPSSFII